MLNLFLILTCALLASANPIKIAKAKLSHAKGLTKADFVVSELPGLTKNIPGEDIPLMFAGQLPLYQENNTHYFFWKFIDQHKDASVENRTIFWLNGGPGCSSMDGALMESGPFRISTKNEVTYNNGSWHKKGDTVYVDQPVGTGFSYGSQYDSELGDLSWHFLTFLDRYFSIFPEDLTNEIVIAGESYAGEYIPYIANAILDRNARIESDSSSTASKYNLRGLLIGNGLIWSDVQSLSYVPFGVQNGLIDPNKPYYADLLAQQDLCQQVINNKTDTIGVSSEECDGIFDLFLQYSRNTSAPKSQQCLNIYDYRLRDSFPACGSNWPPQLKQVTHFLDEKRVESDLNLISKVKWQECSNAVSRTFSGQESLPAITLFPKLLEQVPIILFHGNKDIICNYLGAEIMISKFTWGNQTGFSDNITTYDWIYDDISSGFLRSERNLTYVNVYNASHMVPYNKPEASRALLDILYKNYDIKTGDDGKQEVVTYPIESN